MRTPKMYWSFTFIVRISCVRSKKFPKNRKVTNDNGEIPSRIPSIFVIQLFENENENKENEE